MNQEEQVQGLQLVLLNERGRLLRFLAARGAGDEAEDVLQDLWQRVAAAPAQPIAVEGNGTGDAARGESAVRGDGAAVNNSPTDARP